MNNEQPTYSYDELPKEIQELAYKNAYDWLCSSGACSSDSVLIFLEQDAVFNKNGELVN